MKALNREWKKQAATALFFVLLLLVGLLTADDYTGSYDELAEQGILESNLKEYAICLERLGVRWRYGLELSAAPISQSVEKDHGISAYYLFPLLLSFTDGSQWQRFTLWNAMTWLWFMAGVWSLYALSRRLGASRWLAMLSALVLYCSPRLFAEGHYNNKDIVLLCQMLLCLWQGARFLDRPTLLRGAAFSLCAALACNTRVVGALVWGLVVLGFAARLTLRREWSWKRAGGIAVCALCFLAAYGFLTPALWSDPIGFVQYLLQNASAFSRWSGTLYFRGAAFEIPEQKLPVYYLPYMILVTLPVFVLPLCVVGQLGFLKKLREEKKAFLAGTEGLLLTISTLLWLLPIAGFMVLRPVVYNGWRHFYFCFAGLAVMAGYGLLVLWQMCRGSVWMRRVCAAVLALCFGSTAVGMAVNHPNQGAYYNMLASRATMETDYWNSAGEGALKRLAACETRNPALPLEVGCYFLDIQNARFKLDDALKARLTTTVNRDSPYLYYIENYVQVYNVPEPEGYHVLFTVESYGRLIGTMYERDV